MKGNFFLLALLLMFSCQSKEKQEKETRTPAKQKPVKMFSGKPDLPANDKQITSAGMGKLILGASLDKVDNLYDSVSTIVLYKEGGEWPAKKIFLSDGQWILAESVKSVNQITGIYTNCKEFSTREGYRIGMPLDSIPFQGDSLGTDPGQKAFFLTKPGVFFRIDPHSEKVYFKSPTAPSFKKDIRPSIEEFFIICGDC